MAQSRREWVETETGGCLAEVPAFGYRMIPNSDLTPLLPETEETDLPPVVENRFYRVTFGENGSLSSIFDKEQNRSASWTYDKIELLCPIIY